MPLYKRNEMSERVKEEDVKIKEEPKPNVVKRISDQEGGLKQMMQVWTKVVICQDIVFTGVCGQGEECKFAHSHQEQKHL